MDIFVDLLKKIIEILPTLVSVLISNNYIFLDQDMISKI